MIFLLVFELFLIGFGLFLIVGFISGLPFVPTPKNRLNDVLRLAQIKNNDVFLDLGSGDGRLLIAAAQRGAKAVGWEINPFLILITYCHALLTGVATRVHVNWGDFRKANLPKARVVFLYGITPVMPALSDLILTSQGHGTRVITYRFPLHGKKVQKNTQSGLYLYTL
jgi:hypothetical protein